MHPSSDSPRAVASPARQQSSDQSDSQQCPECAGAVRAEGTEQVCAECGLVLEEDRLDRSPGRVRWADDGQIARTSGATTVALHDNGLGGEIAWSQSESTAETRRRRIDTHSRWQEPNDHNRSYLLGEVHRIASAMELPGTVDRRASSLATEMQEAMCFVGEDLDAGAAAAVYAACRCYELVRPVEAVASVARAEADDVFRLYRKGSVRLSLETPLITPTDWIPRLVDQLGLSEQRRRAALEWARRAEPHETRFSGCKPSGVAAACVYLVTGAGLTQTRIAEVVGISPTTLRKRFRELQSLPDAA